MGRVEIVLHVTSLLFSSGFTETPCYQEKFRFVNAQKSMKSCYYCMMPGAAMQIVFAICSFETLITWF